MRRNFATITSILLALGLTLAVGCKKEEKKGDDKTPDGKTDDKTPDGKTVDTPPDSKTDDKTPDAKDDTALRLNDQKNCPSAVTHAETKVEKGEGNFTVSITSKKLAMVKDIRTRGEHLAKVSETASDKVEHTGGGTGGGLGKCPVVLHKSKITAEQLSHGIKLTITPDDPADLDKLLAMAEARAKDMNERGGVAHGSGAGKGTGEGSGGGKGGKKKDGDAKAPDKAPSGAKAPATPGKKATLSKQPAKKAADKPKKKDDEGGW